MPHMPVIVDYGMGNIHSVIGALRYLDAQPIVSGDPNVIKSADTIILPGVGSFYKAMSRIEASGLADALKEAVLIKKRKILGICLGQQLFAEHGDEDGGHAGLGFISGTVSRIPLSTDDKFKVPHVGFNTVNFDPKSRLFAGFDGQVDCYFVHSYCVPVEPRPGLAATCHYGENFVAAYEHENVMCTQFHPEKSQTNGLKLLSNFLAE